MFDFLKQKIAIFLTRIGQKMLILHDNLEFFLQLERNFHRKRAIFDQR